VPGQRHLPPVQGIELQVSCHPGQGRLQEGRMCRREYPPSALAKLVLRLRFFAPRHAALMQQPTKTST
jgi:hypothetical protein